MCILPLRDSGVSIPSSITSVPIWENAMSWRRTSTISLFPYAVRGWRRLSKRSVIRRIYRKCWASCVVCAGICRKERLPVRCWATSSLMRWTGNWRRWRKNSGWLTVVMPTTLPFRAMSFRKIRCLPGSRKSSGKRSLNRIIRKPVFWMSMTGR